MPKKAKKTRRKRKLAIVMSGGGMRCVYGVGVLTALVEEYGMTKPDIIVASSGSVANAAYYLSGQYRSTIAVMLSLIPDKKVISFTRRKVFDVDYIVDEICKKRYPFNFVELKRSPTVFLLATTRVTDGKTVYMKLPKTNAIYERLRAAKAVPVVYGEEIKIGAQTYIDGDFSCNIEDLTKRAIEEGATHILIVENDPNTRASKMRKKAFMELLYFEKKISGKPGLAKAFARKMKEPAQVTFPAGVQHVMLLPSKKFPISSIERSKRRLRNGFNLGYADAATNKKLRKLLS